MKKYEMPEIDVQQIEIEDVIATSIDEGEKGETGIY